MSLSIDWIRIALDRRVFGEQAEVDAVDVRVGAGGPRIAEFVDIRVTAVVAGQARVAERGHRDRPSLGRPMTT
jgi:hypothetical protein